MRRNVLAGAALVGLAAPALAGPAVAGPVLDRVRQDNVLRCAATERPGFAESGASEPEGLAADLCRRVARAVLGPSGHYALTLTDVDDDGVTASRPDLAFLAPREFPGQRLGAVATVADDIYHDRFALMVPAASTAQAPRDLKDRTVCFMIGDPVWPVLDEAMKQHDIPFRPFGFSEEVEMKDAYNVGRCDALAGVASALEAIRQDGGVLHMTSRLLAEPLGADPVAAVVPANDADWTEAVRKVMAPTVPSANAD